MNGKLKIVLAVAITFTVTTVANVFFNPMRQNEFSELNRVARAVKDNYVGAYDPSEAQEAAINALLGTIDDPYAMYYSPSEAQEFLESVNGIYVGVGIEMAVDRTNDQIVIIGAFEDSPAYTAGAKTLDRIIKIDGVEYKGSESDKAVDYMRGKHLENPEGTKVTLTVLRDGAEMELAMTRERIDMYPVKSRLVGSASQIAYVRYSGFGDDSYKQLVNTLDTIITDGVKCIILDLRSNPGGSFEVSIDICDMFLEKDAPIMFTMNAKGVRTDYTSSFDGIDLPMAVLVDSSSASASEIVAGSLQANGRAKIIGTKTYGKGVSQSLLPLSVSASASLLKLTTLKNYRPDGICIDDGGITPDIEIAADADALERAIQFFEQGE